MSEGKSGIYFDEVDYIVKHHGQNMMSGFTRLAGAKFLATGETIVIEIKLEIRGAIQTPKACQK